MSVAGYHASGLRQRSVAVRGARSKPRNCPPTQDRARRQSSLASVIENTVVPRLVAHHAPRAKPDLEPEVAAFTKILLDPDPSLARELFLTLVDQGHAVDLLFDDLLVPAATRLGAMWDRDEISFLDVVHAMHHVQQIILSEAAPFCSDGLTRGAERHVLLVTLPGEQHRLGLCLLRAHLWREGWVVDCHELHSMWQLQELVRNQRYDAVGISAARISNPVILSRSLQAVRNASCSKDLVMMAGGRAFHADPSLAAAIGVDATAAGGRECVSVLRRFFDHSAAQVS